MRPKIFVVAYVTLTMVCGVQCQQRFSVPEELIGVWVTKGRDYADRPFEIKDDTVIFEQGQGYLDFDVYPIAGGKKSESEGQTLYIIYYTISSGKKFEFSFYYSDANGGEIRFKNQPEMVWTRKRS